jgi:DNA-binding IclR family transcriptional regulator
MTEHAKVELIDSLEVIRGKGHHCLESRQFSGLHPISYPIFDNGNSVCAAITVPYQSRLEDEMQLSRQDVQYALSEAAKKLNYAFRGRE